MIFFAEKKFQSVQRRPSMSRPARTLATAGDDGGRQRQRDPGDGDDTLLLRFIDRHASRFLAGRRHGRPSRPPVAAAARHRALRVVSRSPMGARSFPVSMVALVPVCANRHPPSRSKSAVEDTRSHTTLPVVNMQTPRSTDRTLRRAISTGSCYVISYCCAHSDRYGYQIAGRFSPGWQSRKVSGFSVRY